MSSHWIGAHPPNANQIPVVSSLLKDFSAEALGELRTWLEQNPPAVTISSIIGFDQFTANVATDVLTEETRSVTTYADLATVGPQLTGLPDGKYLLIFGCLCRGDPFAGGFMSPSVNGVAAADNLSATGGGVTGGDVSVTRVVATTLGSGNNTVVSKYRSATGGTNASFLYRWLIALRYANK